jgi:hypothetical protein
VSIVKNIDCVADGEFKHVSVKKAMDDYFERLSLLSVLSSYGLTPTKKHKDQDASRNEHPWIEQWKQWSETEAPEDGHGQDLPVADIIITLIKPPAAVMILHAKNGSHIAIKHFTNLVGHDVASQIWEKAKLQDVKGNASTMELWITKEDDYHVQFVISQEQFQKGVSIKEGMDGYFRTQRVMAFFGSLAIGDAKGSAD